MEGRVDLKGAGELEAACHRVIDLAYGERSNEARGQFAGLHP